MKDSGTINPRLSNKKYQSESLSWASVGAEALKSTISNNSRIWLVKMIAKLYYDDKSTACRAVLLTVSALDLILDLQEIDIFNKENLTPEFIKINPQHTIPVLVDEDLIICDSHAISGYLVAKYGSDSTLYPNDPRERALVDQRLHFDSNILLPRLQNLLKFGNILISLKISQLKRDYFKCFRTSGSSIAEIKAIDVFPIIMLGEKELSKENLDALKEGYSFLNRFLERNAFVAGGNLTIADFSCVASISTGSVILPISSELYPSLFKWYQKCKALPYYDKANGPGLNKLDALIETKLGSAYTKRNA